MENNDAKVEDDVFSKENNSVLRIKDFLESAESKDKSEIITEFQNVLTEYQSVIQDSAKLTKISDTTQNRLKKTKDQLKDLNDSLVDKNNNLTLLGQVGKLVTSTLDVKEILFTIYNSIKPFVTIEILTLGLIEEQQNCIKFKNILVKGEYLPGIHKYYLDEENIITDCIKEQKEIISNDFQNEFPDFVVETTKQTGKDIHSIAYFPLKSNDTIIGVLSFQNLDKNTFKESHVNLLRDMANFIAIGVDNANAYKKLSKRNKELKGTLEEIRNLNDGLEKERAKSEKLLLNILPKSIADQLKDEEKTIADYIESATVLFADLVGFSKLSVDIGSPETLVKLLNEIFTGFDTIAKNYDLEKIKTIGDCYMMAGGVPIRSEDHAERSALAALDIIDFLKEIQQEELTKSVSFRIGLHTGDCVAGVIGKMKFVYDLWGDSVNTASRMESHGSPGKIHCSEAIYNMLQDKFHFEDRGIIDVKGKGLMHTYFLLGKK